MATTKSDKTYGEVASLIRSLNLSLDEIYDLLEELESNTKQLCKDEVDGDYSYIHEVTDDNCSNLTDNI